MTGINGLPRRAFSPAILVLGAALLLVALLAYANSFSVPYLLDDSTTLQHNPALRKAWPIWEALSPITDSGVGGRPLANLAFALNYAATGESLGGLHAVNLVLHLLASLALFGVVRRTLRQPMLGGRFERDADLIALTVTALWLLHPLQTQSVTYLSQRTELLLGLCYFLCLYAFIRATEARRPLGWFSVATVSCLAGVASKESMVTAPVMILLYDYLFVAERDATVIRARRGWFYAALATSWILLYLLMQDLPERGVGFGPAMGSGTYALLAGRAILRYGLLSFWPETLIFDHGNDFAPITPAAFVAPSVVIVIAGLAAWRLLRGSATAFPVVWFLLVLAPTSSVVPIPLQPISENRVYLPLAAIAAGVVLAAYRGTGRRGLIACLALMPAFGALTLHRNHDYRSAIAIWTDTVQKLPGSSRAHNNLGQAYHEAGRLPEAFAEFTTAVTLRPNYQTAHENLALVAGLVGREDLAVKHGRIAVQLDPRRAPAHYNLGVALRNTGNLPAALTAFETAVRLQPNFALAFANLADVHLQQGRTAEALANSTRALALDPRLLTARNAHAAALSDLGRTAEATQLLRATVQDWPDDTNARLLLGNVLLNNGAPADAVTHYEHVLRLSPQHPSARINLASSLLQLGRPNDAIDHAAVATQLSPNQPIARCILGLALAQNGRLVEARAQFEAALRLDPNLALARENLAKIPPPASR